MATPAVGERVVVLGGGIQGAAVAFYLSKYGANVIIVEKSFVAAAASGKAGGFLARNWGHGCTVELQEKSFDLLVDVVKELGILSYREIKALAVDGNKEGTNDASWLDRCAKSSLMVDTATAQVTPVELTKAYVKAAISMGAELKIANATGIKIEHGEVVGVEIEGENVLETRKVVVCLGPWSGVFCEDHFGLRLPMVGIKSTSIIIKDVPSLQAEPRACFCEEDSNHCHLELFSRFGDELYVNGCGLADRVSGDRLRPGGDCERAELIEADPLRVAAAMASLKSMSSVGDRDPDVVQACLRPCTPDAVPVMGKIPSTQGAYLCCGHNCWGIQWSAACGRAMAELVLQDECSSLDLSPFDPLRFMPEEENRGRKVAGVDIGEQW